MAQNDKINMLNPELADQMLSNIFDICEVAPNTVPLEELESYSNYRQDKYLVRRILLILIMVIFLLIPLLFMAPEIMSLKQTGETDPTYKLSVESLLPISSVTATIDGKNIPLYETSTHEYTIEPDVTGDMIVTVKCINHQYAQRKITVTNVDKTPPVVTSNMKKGNNIIIYAEDDISGIDYEKIYAQTITGVTVLPVNYDKKNGRIVFRYPSETLNIFIPDKAGNTLQLLLSVS